MTANSIIEKARTWKEDIIKQAPDFVDKNYGERFITNLLIAFKKNPKLLECEPATIKASVLELASLGLTLGGTRDQASLIPFSESKKVGNQWIKYWKCTLIVGYHGVIDIMARDENYGGVSAEAVYKQDTFTDIKGTKPEIEHKADYSHEYSVDDIIAFYAVKFYKDGRPPLPKTIPRKVVDEAKKKAFEKFEYCKNPSKMIANSPWTQNYAEMGKKTAIKRLAKYMAQNEGMDDFLKVENEIEETHQESPTYDADYVEQQSDDYLIQELENENEN